MSYFKFDEAQKKWRCNACNMMRKCDPKHGYNNMLTHIKDKHPNYMEVVSSLQPDTVSISGELTALTPPELPQTSLQYMVQSKASDVFKWMDWIVMDEHELNFCEQERTRGNTSLSKICNKSLKKYMFKMVDGVKKKIISMVAACHRYALIYDGWTEDNTHFIGTLTIIMLYVLLTEH